jgi:hypothetical protein
MEPVEVETIKDIQINYKMRVVRDRLPDGTTRTRLIITATDAKGNTINNEYVGPFLIELDEIFERFDRLYYALEVGAARNNKMLYDGARSELLSLFALLIARVY